MTTSIATDTKISESKFDVDFKPSVIVIKNEESLKKLVDETISYYGTLIFDDNNIPEAKQAKSDLNKVSKLLDDQRKSVKKEYNAPLKEFEAKINGYVAQIKMVSEGINQSVLSYEESEKQKRLAKIESLITEIAPNYGINSQELEINSSWLNKGSFTTKGEVNKKTLEDITFNMTLIANEKKRVEGDKKIIANHAIAKGLEPDSWICHIDMGKTADELMEAIDDAVVQKQLREKKQEADRKAKEEYEAAMNQLANEQQTTVEKNVIDTETGEIIKTLSTNNAAKNVKENTMTFTLEVTGTYQALMDMNAFMKANNISYRKVGNNND